MSDQLPDITKDTNSSSPAAIAWVGMSGIDYPLRVAADEGEQSVAAKVDVFVNLLDPRAKGIHMSRLYLGIQELQQPLTGAVLLELLQRLVATQDQLSDRVKLKLSFPWLLAHSSLLSGKVGWKSYPIEIGAVYSPDGLELELGFDFYYSSTCPCSAALARALIADSFRARFDAAAGDQSEAMHAWLNSEAGINATPHSQRSRASCRLRWRNWEGTLPISSSIAVAEQALSTAVQTAVKRRDEQEFARLNAANLMFCEDAVRRLRAAYEARPEISDYRLRVQHMESLHAHDAEALVCKGIAGGLQP